MIHEVTNLRSGRVVMCEMAKAWRLYKRLKSASISVGGILVAKK